ncbi:recombination associated protein RdgC [Oryzisolibacter propanilivorax]|uniref:Recombination-associated protein RdgC n=1 Tax=Oryzisolibacter propanilivorax TaxID=1527607 RepID=A0A1G9SKQ3_9BURK|nr:recombination-associated protein RdgC [Oryzisolibacter propanilivorax]SDM36058.1 recombination associated protein RdgC [Oryzisolibacter propanilivorax]
MFTSLTLYRIGALFDADLPAIEQALAKTPFTKCTPTQERSAGWVPPRGWSTGALVESVGGQWIARFMTEAKQIPADVLRRRVDTKAEAIERETGRTPGKKERRELQDEARLDLLPHAFARQAATWVWIDPGARLLAIDTGTQSRADQIATALVEALPGLSLALLDTQTSPQAAMAHWLKEQEPPAGFAIDRECELKSGAEDKAVVRYARHPLDIDEVRAHIEAGKLPTRLAMAWDDRVSFVLTEGLQLRKVQLLDVVLEGGEAEGGFDADVAIATGELVRLVPELVEALGGERCVA